jgi:hypothetical protein
VRVRGTGGAAYVGVVSAEAVDERPRPPRDPTVGLSLGPDGVLRWAGVLMSEVPVYEFLVWRSRYVPVVRRLWVS